MVKAGDSPTVTLRSNPTPRQRPLSVNLRSQSPVSLSAVQRLDSLVG
uniref:Uncharacterized protein n=1 Tax=Ciona savignyi TaxID=51511 RepID=H2ZQI8_CIOSA